MSVNCKPRNETTLQYETLLLMKDTPLPQSLGKLSTWNQICNGVIMFFKSLKPQAPDDWTGLFLKVKLKIWLGVCC